MPTLHIHIPNPTLYIAFLALGLLSAIKSGAISPEAGIWTLRMPKNYDEIQPYCPPKLQNIIAYSGLNLNQDKAASRRQYTRYGKASQRCTGLNLIHYSFQVAF